jgi:hypothetical protein
MNLSNCCGSPVKVDCSDEGTCCYLCEKCGFDCDVIIHDAPWQERDINEALADLRNYEAKVLKMIKELK